MEPLDDVNINRPELEKSLSLVDSPSIAPLFLGTRHRHWSTGSQLSSSSSSGSSLDSLREKLEKSDYFIVRRKRLGLFSHKSRHGSLDRYKRRSCSESDGQDLFTSTKALRDSFKSVSFLQPLTSTSSANQRRGSAPTLSCLPSKSNPSQSGSVSESEGYGKGRVSLIDKPKRGILKSSSGSESSLQGETSKDVPVPATIVKTHIKIISKPSAESGSNSPAASLSRQNSSEKDVVDDDERLFLVKTITKKISGITQQNMPGVGASESVSELEPEHQPGASSGESAGSSKRRSRYAMQNLDVNSSLTPPRRKISNCREEDEEELRKESIIKNRKKKKSRDEQRERRLSTNLKRKEYDQGELSANEQEKLDEMMSNANSTNGHPESTIGFAGNMNAHRENQNGVNHFMLDIYDETSSRVSTSGIEISSKSEEDLHRLLQNNLNVSPQDDVTSAEEKPASVTTTTDNVEFNSVNNNTPQNPINYVKKYSEETREKDDCFDCTEADDKISDIDTSFSQSLNLNYDYSYRRQSDSSFTESFKHLKPFDFDLEPINEGKRERLYKVLVVGELGTGKTSVIKRYVHQFFSQHYRATIGVDFALKVLRWDPETVVRLQLWDIAGQERFGSMTRVYYKEAVGAFVVFDVTRAATLEAVPKWKADLDSKVVLPDGRPIPTVLLANKCDQPREGIAANREKMNEFCQQQGFTSWFETSAKDNTNIDEAANYLVSKILDIDRWSQEPMGSDPEKLDLGSNGKHRVGNSSNCSC